MDREKVIHAVETAFELWIDEYTGCSWFKEDEVRQAKEDALAMLKEQKNEYENGFNDAMLGKQELMYEGTDGKWHKKDW